MVVLAVPAQVELSSLVSPVVVASGAVLKEVWA